MDKNEILKRSKKFYRNSDPYEVYYKDLGTGFGILASLIIAFILFILEYFLTHENNYGLMGIAFSAPAACFTYVAVKIRKKRFIIEAIITGVGVIICIVPHIISLVRV